MNFIHFSPFNPLKSLHYSPILLPLIFLFDAKTTFNKMQIFSQQILMMLVVEEGEDKENV